MRWLVCIKVCYKTCPTVYTLVYMIVNVYYEKLNIEKQIIYTAFYCSLAYAILH